MFDLSALEILIRIVLGVIFGGIIGYDREIKGQSAGFRTHMLVCVGSVIIALIQIQAVNQVLDLAAGNEEYLQIISIDQTRLTAQIVSGIGFLGAGTIIVTKRSVSGLTTAASIWATAGIGIAVGMGYYMIAIMGTLTIVIVLALIKNKLRVMVGENIVVRYLEQETQAKIIDYFETHQIKYFVAEFRIENDIEHNQTIYTEHFILNLSSRQMLSKVIQDIGEFDSVIYASSQHITV